jgi:small subunit ribosomal protein S16
MVKFKLVPFGKKHQIHYRICVVPKESKLSGSVIEVVGHYHPLQNHALQIDLQRIKHWLSKGVQPTPRIAKLISKASK